MTNLSDQGRAGRLVREFKRKGGEGRWTHPFRALPEEHRTLLLGQVDLSPGELPILVCSKSPADWVLLTSRRLVVHQPGCALNLLWADIEDATVDEAHKRAVFSSRQLGKEGWERLKVILRCGGAAEVQLEAGPAFFGFWNVLRAVGSMSSTRPPTNLAGGKCR